MFTDMLQWVMGKRKVARLNKILTLKKSYLKKQMFSASFLLVLLPLICLRSMISEINGMCTM